MVVIKGAEVIAGSRCSLAEDRVRNAPSPEAEITF